jgi:RNA polymerase sigma-70 factor (ECF subfamily)
VNTPAVADRDSNQYSRGDVARYERLFSRYAPLVKAYMMRRGLPAAAAEELAQEVMLTVWSKAEYFDAQRAPLRTWVFTIARNRCIDQLRRGRRPKPDPEDPCWVETVRPPEGPESMAVDRRREDRVHEALSTLNEEQRCTLRQLYFEGLTTSEAADAQGVPVGTIKSRARRALHALRETLGMEGMEDA